MMVSIRSSYRPPRRPVVVVARVLLLLLLLLALMVPVHFFCVESLVAPRQTPLSWRCWSPRPSSSPPPLLLRKNAAADPGPSDNNEEEEPAAAPLDNHHHPAKEERMILANRLQLLQQEIELENRSILLAAQQRDDDPAVVLTADEEAAPASLILKRPNHHRHRNDYYSLDPYQRCLVLAGTAALLACGWNALLHGCEWFQAWRYAWPGGLGGLFVADAVRHCFFADGWSSTSSSSSGESSNDNTNDAGTPLLLLDLRLQQPGWVRCLNAVAGLGLLVGGAYDAFMPVWMTGPNVVTAAGIGQDSAALLCVLTAVGATTATATNNNNNNNNSEKTDKQQQFAGAHGVPTVLSHAVLLSQLYILGDSAFQDLLSGTAFS